MGILHETPYVKFSIVVLLAVVVTGVSQAQPIEGFEIFYKDIGFCFKTPPCRRRCLGLQYDGGKCVSHKCLCYLQTVEPQIPPPIISPGPPEPTSSSISPPLEVQPPPL